MEKNKYAILWWSWRWIIFGRWFNGFRKNVWIRYKEIYYSYYFWIWSQRALEVGEENIYDFSIGNPNVPAPDFVKQAIIDILNEMDPCAVHGYTVAPGNPEVREVLAKDINRRFCSYHFFKLIKLNLKIIYFGRSFECKIKRI